MNRKRLAGTLLAGSGLLIVAVALAQSNGSQTADLSKEWPTYGHDSGGMRFSPLTQITPSNVNNLKVAWVYHMRPPGPLPPAGRGYAEGEGAGGGQARGRGAGAGEAAGRGQGRGQGAGEGEAAAAGQGRGRGRSG